jgi:hypothetical protein
MSVRDIAGEIGMSKSAVHRMIKRMQADSVARPQASRREVNGGGRHQPDGSMSCAQTSRFPGVGAGDGRTAPSGAQRG